MSETDSTSRGKFRSVEMDLLSESAKLDIWGKEISVNTYLYPILVKNPERLIDQARKLAKVNPSIPDEELAMTGPFLVTTSPESHIGPYKTAMDFLVPDGSVVVATRTGRIVEVQQHSKKYGAGPQFRDYLNYVTLVHDNGEYSQYCHLKRNSIAKLNLSVGSQVEAGQPIAKTGKSGWTDRDHLHFIVFRSKKETESQNPFGFLGLIPRFES
jgi:murein DD-endopeptidase MepM/ murein hydrolase activator NlpD